MSRTLIWQTVGLILLTGADAQAERFMAFTANYSGQFAPPQGTFHFGSAPIGSSTVQEFLTLSFEPTDNGNLGDVARLMRDRAIPDAGIPGVCRKAIAGTTAIQVFHADSMQFWGSSDGSNWQLIEHGIAPGSIWLRLQQQGQPWFLDVSEFGTNAQVASGNVPAVGSIGLVTLVVILLATGVFIMTKRSRPSDF